MAATTRLELDTQVGDLGTVDEETRARIRSMDADTRVRIVMALAISALFVALNAAVIYLVWHAFNADIRLLQAKLISPGQRLVTDSVFMSLIGATVVQVGVILVAIAGYLFPKKG
jgi:hypothetical protein